MDMVPPRSAGEGATPDAWGDLAKLPAQVVARSDDTASHIIIATTEQLITGPPTAGNATAEITDSFPPQRRDS